MTFGWTPTTHPPRIMVVLSVLNLGANSEEQTTIATAPSVRGEEVAAVTVPFSSKASGSLAMLSRVVVGLMQPSLSTVPPPPVSIPMMLGFCVSLSAALVWLVSAKASCSSREIPYILATFSAVAPIET